MYAATARLAAMTADCASAEEYRSARTEWLHAVIACDAIYQGAVSSSRNFAPVVTGVSHEVTASCEANSDRYWRDRDRLNDAATNAGGIAVDVDVLSPTERRESVFYREVMHTLRIHATLVAVLQLRGEPASCVWLGRTGRHARFASATELATLREALPILAIGEGLHAKGPAGPMRFDLGLTAREHDVTRYLARGLTNGEIAALLGTSPATVKNQVATILRKTGSANRTELTWRLRAMTRP